MANLSFSVQGPAMDFSVTIPLEDEDTPRIIGYLMSTHYGKITEDEVERDATPSEAAEGFAKGILNGLLDQTYRYEMQLAMEQAASSVSKIEPKKDLRKTNAW